MKKLLLAAALALACVPAFADPGIQRVPCGFQQLTATTLQSLTVPTSCGGQVTMVRFRAEVQALRYRDDGTAPTTSIGMPVLVADPPVEYQGTISALQFIAETSGGIVDVLYYR